MFTYEKCKSGQGLRKDSVRKEWDVLNLISVKRLPNLDGLSDFHKLLKMRVRNYAPFMISFLVQFYLSSEAKLNKQPNIL